jgi:hypothetical protein
MVIGFGGFKTFFRRLEKNDGVLVSLRAAINFS